MNLNDLPAVTRLVYWAGLLGSRVLISSATLPPSLVQGMFEAYWHGRSCFKKNRGELPEEPPGICCAWVDEANCVQKDCWEPKSFAAQHNQYVEKRSALLVKAKPRRQAELVTLQQPANIKDARANFATQALQGALHLHESHHSLDSFSSKRVSFGLIRMANIEPLFDVALALYKYAIPQNFMVHLCVYHSRFPLLLRSGIERSLDAALDRRTPEQVFTLPDIRSRLELSAASDHLFVVLGSPVTEVGRDHDYDWAVVEPSSMRSIIQLAGRVRRHREPLCATPNILVFDRNIKSVERPGEPAYQRPGFEGDGMLLKDHSLHKLLNAEALAVVDARPRIVAPPSLQPESNFIHLEHARLAKTMLAPEQQQRSERAKRLGLGAILPGAYSCWLHKRSLLSGLLQKEQRFRKTGESMLDMVLLPNADEDDYILTKLFDPHTNSLVDVPVETLNHRVPDEDVTGERIQPWGAICYMDELKNLASDLDMDIISCARRFGTVSLPESVHGWNFHPALGFSRNR